MPDLRGSEWRPGPVPGAHWERCSRNGEGCIMGLVPPFPGGARLASCLTWLMRSFASRCRRTHDATGALAFTCTGARAPSTLAWAMALSFDLALEGPAMIHPRVRRRGGDPGACRWPAFWLEGEVYDYLVHAQPVPSGRTPRRKLVVLDEERQAGAKRRPRRKGGAE